MAVAPSLLGNHRSRRIPLVGIREGEMTMSAIAILRQLTGSVVGWEAKTHPRMDRD